MTSRPKSNGKTADPLRSKATTPSERGETEETILPRSQPHADAERSAEIPPGAREINYKHVARLLQQRVGELEFEKAAVHGALAECEDEREHASTQLAAATSMIDQLMAERAERSSDGS